MMAFKVELKIAVQAENEEDKLAGATYVRLFELLIQKKRLSERGSLRPNTRDAATFS